MSTPGPFWKHPRVPTFLDMRYQEGVTPRVTQLSLYPETDRLAIDLTHFEWNGTTWALSNSEEIYLTPDQIDRLINDLTTIKNAILERIEKGA